jgi:YbbR domain-containing protein
MIAFLRQLIVHDFWLKLFSLVLAFLIWFTVSLALQKEGAPVPTALGTKKQRVFFNLPVFINSSAEELRQAHVDPKDVAVTVEGEPGVVESLTSADVRVSVDLTGIQDAQTRRRVQVSTPAGISHIRVVPEEVEVTFTRKG